MGKSAGVILSADYYLTANNLRYHKDSFKCFNQSINQSIIECKAQKRQLESHLIDGIYPTETP